MGHIINQEGISFYPAKLEAVMRWEILKNASEILSFWGLTGYYRRFIQEFSKIVVPLTCLTKKNVTFQWGIDKQLAFETLRLRLFEAPILVLSEG